MSNYTFTRDNVNHYHIFDRKAVLKHGDVVSAEGGGYLLSSYVTVNQGVTTLNFIDDDDGIPIELTNTIENPIELYGGPEFKMIRYCVSTTHPNFEYLKTLFNAPENWYDYSYFILCQKNTCRGFNKLVKRIINI